MKALFGIFLAVLLIGLVGCGSSDVSASDVKKDDESRKAYEDDYLKKNPPPPGEGPGN